MKVTVERTPESEAVLNVELDWAELEKASERAYRKMVQKYNVPGFRRGHAPRTMLERMLGKEAIYQEGLEDLIDESYRTAIREHHLQPIAQPSIDAPPIEIGQPYSFVAHVPVLSPAELGDYTSIRVEQAPIEVTDEEIQQVLERVQQDQTMWLPAERPAQLGDQVLADLTLTVGEREISNLHDNEFELTDDRHGIFSGMDEHLVGMSEGEAKEFSTTIPEDYANAELAGKEARFAVTLKGVKYRELPALDDELAKSIGDFETLDAVRAAVREQLRSQKESEARRDLRERVTAAAADQAKVDIHPVLVSDEVDAMMRETERMLAQNRITMAQYLAMSKKSEAEYRKELEPDALQRVKRDLVLSAVADAEHLDVTDAEMENWLAALNALGGKPTRLRELTAGQRANVESRLRRDKALTRLIEIATEGRSTAEGQSVAEQGGEGSVTGESAPEPGAAPASERGAKAAAAPAAVDQPDQVAAGDAAPDEVGDGERPDAERAEVPEPGA